MIDALGIEDLGDILDRLRRKLSSHARKAYLIGSILERAAIPGESDLDILIVPTKNEDFFELLKDEINEILDLGLSPHIIIADNPTSKYLLIEARSRGYRIA